MKQKDTPTPQEGKKEKKASDDPEFDFVPKFYILDMCENTVLAARGQDKYEVKGMYVKWDAKKKEWEMWEACFNNQLAWEFPTRYVITNNNQEAWLYAIMMSTVKALPNEWCLERHPRSKDFPKY